MPVCASNGASAARKSCCSCAVHSAHTVTDPPIFPVDELVLEAGVGVDEPHAVATPRTPAVTTASLPSVLTCVIGSPQQGQNPRPAPGDPVCVVHLCTPSVLETQPPQILSHTNG